MFLWSDQGAGGPSSLAPAQLALTTKPPADPFSSRSRKAMGKPPTASGSARLLSGHCLLRMPLLSERGNPGCLSPQWALHPSHPSVHFPEDLLLSLARKSSSLTERWRQNGIRLVPTSAILLGVCHWALTASLPSPCFHCKANWGAQGQRRAKGHKPTNSISRAQVQWGYRLCRALLPSLWQTALLGYGEGVGRMPQDSRRDSRSLAFKCFA